MRRARPWGWARMRRYDDPYNDLGPSSPHQSCPDCIIAMRGYDFREGQRFRLMDAKELHMLQKRDVKISLAPSAAMDHLRSRQMIYSQ
jgi:hypothetical protein